VIFAEADRMASPPASAIDESSRPVGVAPRWVPPKSRQEDLVPGVAEPVAGWFLSVMHRWRNLAVGAFSGGCLAVLLVGCETYGRADWNARVGNYTWDQSLQELGPPESEAKTSDGTRVADWVVSRSRTYSSAVRGPMFWSWSGQDVTTTAESHLLLTFGPDGRLRSWKRLYK